MKLCPVCKELYKPGPYAEHMKKHVRRGEVVKVEVVQAEAGNVTHRQWQRTAIYSLRKKVKS